MENQNKFVEKVRNSYTPHERTKLDELRELDKKAKTPALVFAYIFGVTASLILGVGMCLAMKIIGTALMSSAALTAVGVTVGCAGIAMCIANYYVYKAILNSRKKKYGSQIVNLSNAILNKTDTL